MSKNLDDIRLPTNSKQTTSIQLNPPPNQFYAARANQPFHRFSVPHAVPPHFPFLFPPNQIPKQFVPPFRTSFNYNQPNFNFIFNEFNYNELLY